MESEKYVRRQYLIKQGLQYRFSFMIIILVAFMTIVSIAAVYSIIWGDIYKEVKVYNDIRYVEVLKMIFYKTTRFMIIISAGIISIFGLLSIFISHRIAGPLFKCEKSIESILKGDLTFRIHLRRGDEMQELAKLINSVMDDMQKTTVSARQTADSLMKLSWKLSKNRSSNNVLTAEELKKIAERTKKTVEKYSVQ
jgi:methyl-accepting chemotaxis protein